jgi:enediyne biosynthesis protein E4
VRRPSRVAVPRVLAVLLAALAALAPACDGPPGVVMIPDAGAIDGAPDGAIDASLPPDAAGEPDAPIDAAVDAAADAMVDATIFDAGPDAMPPDADPSNPWGIHFQDVTLSALGGYLLGGRAAIDLWGVGTGALVGDVTGDGLIDVILTRNNDLASPRPGGPTQLMRNTGGYTFTMDPGLSMSGVHAHGGALGDYDNDGDLDIFIAASGFDWLLENDGTGAFVDATLSGGVAGRGDDVSVGAVFADVNLDGLLDLYVYNHTAASPPWPDGRAENRLYLNVGDGEFVDVTEESGTGSQGSSQATAVFPLDGDGYPTIYVANDRFYVDGSPAYGMHELIPGDAWYHFQALDGEGIPSFIDVATDRGVFDGRSSMGISIYDVDHDLTPDVYISDWGKKDLYTNPVPGTPTIYSTDVWNVAVRRDPDGYNMISWGVRFVDFDRDGFGELFVVNGGVNEPFTCDGYHQLDWFLRQPGAGLQYEVITGSVGLPTTVVCFADAATVGRGFLLGDFDADGDDDFLITPYIETYRFYENQTPLGIHHELRVRLHGTVSAPDPVGATITVTHLDGSRSAHFRYAGGDTFSQSDSIVRAGLGDDASVLEAIVEWPSGYAQHIEALPGFAPDVELNITEPQWMSVVPRVVTMADPAPVFTYTAVDDEGTLLGTAGAGRIVTVTRSDGVAVVVTDNGDGTYTADLGHPGVARRTVLTVNVDGVNVRARPMIRYR